MSADKKFEEITDKFEKLNVDQNDPDVTDSKYVVRFVSLSGKFESWYYFIRYQGNEKALEYLQKQLEKIDMYIYLMILVHSVLIWSFLFRTNNKND